MLLFLMTGAAGASAAAGTSGFPARPAGTENGQSGKLPFYMRTLAMHTLDRIIRLTEGTKQVKLLTAVLTFEFINRHFPSLSDFQRQKI